MKLAAKYPCRACGHHFRDHTKNGVRCYCETFTGLPCEGNDKFCEAKNCNCDNFIPDNLKYLMQKAK